MPRTTCPHRFMCAVRACGPVRRPHMFPRTAQSKDGGPVRIVNDGVTIAGEVDLESNVENIGVKLLLQAAERTDSRAGDGTTTSTVLTQAIVNEGAKYVQAGGDAIALSKGLIKAASFFVTKIREVR